MEINQLRYFRTVAYCESITKAAAQLHITQSALSKVVSRLENELGFLLFSREGGKLCLNTNGLTFLKYADRTLNALDACMQEMSLSSAGAISIGHTDPYFIRGIIETCQALYPGIIITDEVLTPAKCKAGFESGKTTVAILPMPEGASEGCSPLYTEQWCAMMHTAHPLARLSGDVNLAETATHPAVFCGDIETYNFLLLLIEKHGLTPNFILQTPDAYEAQRLISRGVAFGIAPITVYHSLMLRCPGIPIVARQYSETNLCRTVYINKSRLYPADQQAEALFQMLKDAICAAWQGLCQLAAQQYYSESAENKGGPSGAKPEDPQKRVDFYENWASRSR